MPSEPEAPVIYGRPGSKSAVMERVMRDSFAEDKAQVAQPVPMNLDQVVDAVATSTPAVQYCEHGEMVLKTGIAKGRGTPYYGYTCPRGCAARWAVMSKDGKWYYPDSNNG
jgi:hypothetical protein